MRYARVVPEKDEVDDILDQWQRERPDLDASPMGVIGRLSRLSRELERRLDPVYARNGLEAGLFDVLATLRRAGAPHRMRPADLAQAMMLTSSGTTKRLDRLESAGLIVRRPDPDDRRGLLIELTPAGRQLVDAAVTDHVANEHRLLQALTLTERNQLARLLRKLALDLPPIEPDTNRPRGQRHRPQRGS